MGKEYILKTIEDIIMLIPEDRLDEFLLDFKQFAGAARSTKNLVDKVAEVVGAEQPKATITMRWIDDGKREGKVIITSPPPQSEAGL